MKIAVVSAVLLASLASASPLRAEGRSGCRTAAAGATIEVPILEGGDAAIRLRTIERGGGDRLYLVDPGMEAALVPLVDRIERGLARLEADGWKVPSDRSRPVEIAIVSAPGEGAIAGTRRGGGPVVQVDIGMVPVDALDRLAPEILHQLAHLFLSSYARTEGSWWAESTARHLAGRAEESGLPKPAATPEGLVGPASPEGFGEREFADAVASSVGESGLVRIWEEARGGPAEDSLRKTFERLAGKSLEEFVLEQALARESAATSARTPVSSAPGTSEWNAGVPKGAAWWVSRFRPDGSGGGEVLLDPAAGDFAVRLVVAYRAADRVPDVVELLPGVPARVPLAGVDRLSVVAAPADLDRAPLASPAIRFRGLADFPFRLEGKPTINARDGEATISWDVAAQTDVLGWRIERREEREGTEVFSAETILPSSDEEDGTFSYRLIENDLEPGRTYSWDVEAVTASGIMARGFHLEARGMAVASAE